jgi:hypothetical protein
MIISAVMDMERIIDMTMAMAITRTSDTMTMDMARTTDLKMTVGMVRRSITSTKTKYARTTLNLKPKMICRTRTGRSPYLLPTWPPAGGETMSRTHTPAEVLPVTTKKTPSTGETSADNDGQPVDILKQKVAPMINLEDLKKFEAYRISSP